MAEEVTDFARILTELKEEHDINDYDMEKLTGKDRSKFTKLRTRARKQANYDDGREIVRIYEETTGKSAHSK